ncbi:MAG: hypothetical protein K2X03_03480 [Bryobacteraceae bacterium]|nr:hypothetical protein [Bryobacteraceae bacterium]
MGKQAGAFGLDVGTSRVVLAQQSEGGRYDYRSQLNAFVALPYSKMTENVLRKENIPHKVEGDQLIVHGNESERFADLLQMEARRPMTKGVLNPSETASGEMMRQLIQSLNGGEAGAGRSLYYSVPAAPLGEEANVTYHEATLGQILRDLGYTPKAINEGLAVVYGEMEETNYSGIGISCGGGLCNVCLAYLSVPVLSFAVPKAGDFIDQSAAQITGELSTRIRITKESNFHINGHYADKVQQVLGVYYDDMIKSLVDGLNHTLANTRNMPRIAKPVPIVLSGGTVMPAGFRERFEKILKESAFPLAISEVRMASDPLTATAKGALVAALAEA